MHSSFECSPWPELGRNVQVSLSYRSTQYTRLGLLYTTDLLYILQTNRSPRTSGDIPNCTSGAKWVRHLANYCKTMLSPLQRSLPKVAKPVSPSLSLLCSPPTRVMFSTNGHDCFFSRRPGLEVKVLTVPSIKAFHFEEIYRRYIDGQSD